MITPIKPATRSAREPIPPLHEGDRMEAEEFHRRYLAEPDVRAELIEGVVHMSSPVSFHHGIPHAKMVLALGFYAVHTPGIEFCDNTSLRSNSNNEFQPDVMLYVSPQHGGKIQEGLPLQGAPELIAEICYTTKKNDLKNKFKVYAESGIREYVVWRVEDDEIDWFHLVDSTYQPMPRDSEGIIRSAVFPGLWIPISALALQEMPKVMNVLQQGLASPEHTEFVKHLAETVK